MNYIETGRIKIDKTILNNNRVAYHDPCNYGRKSEKLFGYGYYKEPRLVLDYCVPNWVDLYPSKDNQFCCGGGGGSLTTGYNKERIYYGRKKIEQFKASKADLIVTPCHSCHGQFNNIKKEYKIEYLKIKYLWEIVADAIISKN
ncbi:MAG: hypothetical protein HQK79_08870 [Desulfobacterales bacterium]|nr:hypothetical protein [Desulfobacterales bacterium]